MDNETLAAQLAAHVNAGIQDLPLEAAIDVLEDVISDLKISLSALYEDQRRVEG